MGICVEEIVKPRIDGCTVSWVGRSSVRYTTNVEPIGGNFVESPGIYIFCDFRRGEVVPVYVGYTDNLQRRLTTDLSWTPQWREIVAAGAHFVCYLAVESREVDLAAVVEDLRLGISSDVLDNCGEKGSQL